MVQATSISKRLATRRAKQRWIALVSAPTSNLASYMRERMGEGVWSEFVSYANEHYMARSVRAFCKPNLRCVGRLDGTPCPHAFEVDLASPDAEGKLKFLHLEHERPVRRTCERWSYALPESPASWHDGLDGGALCHDLLGAYNDEQYGGKCLRFRYGPPHGMRYAQHAYCHTE